jgi:hypothetical protein
VLQDGILAMGEVAGPQRRKSRENIRNRTWVGHG